MTPKEKAEELFDKMYSWQLASVKTYTPNVAIVIAQQSAIIAVDEIINSNPHSNPFNTNVFSTMGFWQEVKIEIIKL